MPDTSMDLQGYRAMTHRPLAHKPGDLGVLETDFLPRNRGKKDGPERWLYLELSPAEARQMADALNTLADMIEGKDA